MPTSLKVLVYLNTVSILLPVAMQYVASVSLLIWLIVNKMLLKRKLPIRFLYDADQNSFEGLRSLLMLFFIASVAVCVFGSLQSDFELPLGKIISDAWHLSAKQTILPLVLLGSFILMKGRFEVMPDFAKSVTIFVSLYTAYCLLQRYTGVDWVRGFAGELPPNRFAYGVYRISGFMGHPLSLAYNLVFATILFLFYGSNAFSEGQKSRAFWWFGSAAQCSIILLLSGSRWPLIVLALALSLFFASAILSRWKWVVLAASLACGVLYIEGSALNRVKEVYNNGEIKTENIPRLVFWKIHWQMFKDQPFWGVGYSARQVAAVDYYDKNGYTHIERKYSAHNQYLQVLADSGLFGIAILVVFWVAAWMLFKLVTDSTVKKALFVYLFIIALSCLMKNVLRDTEFIFAVWLCIALSYASLPLKKKTWNGDGTAETSKTKNLQSAENLSYSR